MSAVYLAYFSNRVLKVGASGAPRKRRTALRLAMWESGHTLDRFIVFDGFMSNSVAEAILVNTMLSMGFERTGREWFINVELDLVIDRLQEAMEEEMKKQHQSYLSHWSSPFVWSARAHTPRTHTTFS